MKKQQIIARMLTTVSPNDFAVEAVASVLGECNFNGPYSMIAAALRENNPDDVQVNFNVEGDIQAMGEEVSVATDICWIKALLEFRKAIDANDDANDAANDADAA